MKQFLTCLVVVLLVGCATAKPHPAPLSLADIMSMSKAGLSDGEIIQRVEGTRTVFKLTSDDVVRLRNEGVSNGVVTYMLDTYTRAAMEEQRQRDSDEIRSQWGFYYGHPYW
ncbi:MAG: hypothetical protein ABSC38_00430 [Verrucomicrobiia bacterium]